MYAERKIKLWLERMCLQWKGVGKLMYLPFLVNYIILPVFAVFSAKASEFYDEGDYFIEYGFYFIPFLSVWWIILILQEYMEGIGHEVVWIYDRQKFPDVVVCFLMYFFSMMPLFTWVQRYWEVNPQNLVDMFAQSYFYLGITFFMIFAVHSVVAAIVSVFAYTLFSQTLFEKLIELFSITDFRSGKGYIFLGTCLLLLGLGTTCRKRI